MQMILDGLSCLTDVDTVLYVFKCPPPQFQLQFQLL